MFELFSKKKNGMTAKAEGTSEKWTDAQWKRALKEDADRFTESTIRGLIGYLENGWVFEKEYNGVTLKQEDFAFQEGVAVNFNVVGSKIIHEDHIVNAKELNGLRNHPMPSAKERDEIREYIKENWRHGYLEDDFHPDASIVGDFLAEVMDWSKGHIKEGIRQNGYVKDEMYIEEFDSRDRMYSKEYLVCQTDYDNMWLRLAENWFLSIAVYNYLRSVGMIPIITAGGFGEKADEWIKEHVREYEIIDDDGSVLVSDYRIPISKKDEVMRQNPEFHMNEQAFKED